MAQTKIVYDNKDNPVPIVNRKQQATAEDFNDIKSVVNENAYDVDGLRVLVEAINGYLPQGEIDVASDFPTSAAVKTGHLYVIGTNVTDNNPAKTNTGISFIAGVSIVWSEENTWIDLGSNYVTTDQKAKLDNAANYRGTIDLLSPAVVSTFEGMTVTPTEDGPYPNFLDSGAQPLVKDNELCVFVYESSAWTKKIIGGNIYGGFSAWHSTSFLKINPGSYTLSINGTFNFYHVREGGIFNRYSVDDGDYVLSGNNKIIGFDPTGVAVGGVVTIQTLSKTTTSKANFIVIASTGANGVLSDSSNAPILIGLNPIESYVTFEKLEVDGLDVIITGDFNFIYRKESGIWIRYRLTAGTYVFTTNNRSLIIDFDGAVADSYITPTIEVSNNLAKSESVVIFATNANNNVVQILANSNLREKPSGSIEPFAVGINTAYADYINTDLLLQSDFVNGDDRCAIRFPDNYSPTGKPHKLIIYCHGAGTPVTSLINNLSKPELIYFASRGYAIIDVNTIPEQLKQAWMHPTQCAGMGSPISIRSVEKAYKYAVENYNIADDGCFIFSTSMGGLTAGNLVANSNLPVLATWMDTPVTGLFESAWVHPWWGADSGEQVHMQIAYLYGFDNLDTVLKTFTVVGGIYAGTYDFNDSWNLVEVNGHEKLNAYYDENIYYALGYNPWKNRRITEGSTDQIQYPCPLVISHGSGDAVNDINTNKDYLNLVAAYGQFARFREVNTSHHGTTDQGTQILDENSVLVYPINLEVYRFFEKYNR